MNELFQFALIVLTLAVCLAAFFAALGVFFPLRIARSLAAYTASPGRALVIGLVNALFFGVVALVAASAAGESQGAVLLGFLVLAAPLSGMCVGLAALVQHTGARLAPDSGFLQRTALGATVLALAGALPVVGWFLFLPFLLLAGLGSFVISLVRRDLPDNL